LEQLPSLGVKASNPGSTAMKKLIELLDDKDRIFFQQWTDANVAVFSRAGELAVAYKARTDLPHYLRMRRAMLSACSETCSRLLTSVATAARERSGRCAQMASASLCHRSHRAALVATRLALARAKLRLCFGVVGWSSPSMLGAVVLCARIKSTEHSRFHARDQPRRVWYLGDKSGRPRKHTYQAGTVGFSTLCHSSAAPLFQSASISLETARAISR